MVYRSSTFNKELRQSYYDSLSSRHKLFMICLFMALITIALHLLFQITEESVMVELFPELLLPSYFTMTYTYNLVAYIFFTIFFINKYSNITLSEIGENKWYLLSKMGYNVTSIILNKMFMTVVIVLLLYACGFVLTVLLTALFKYVFVIDYLLPAFVAGVINVLLIVEAALVISLYSHTKVNAKNSLLIVIIINEILKIALGYYKLITDRVLMSDISNLLNPSHSVYGIILLAALVLMILFAYIGAKRRSNYYTLKGDVSGVTIVRHNEVRTIAPQGQGKHPALSLPAILFRVLLTAVLIGSIAFNILILVASLGSNTREFSVFGYIPYLIRSQTMEDAIYKNDLALFKRIDSSYPLKVGDIVLFGSEVDDNDVFIMEIIRIDGDRVLTDMKKYPVLYEKDSLQQIIDRKAIYGIFYDNYRILGAIVLFINSFPGRILTLFLPIIVLFFYPQVTSFIKRFRAVMQA